MTQHQEAVSTSWSYTDKLLHSVIVATSTPLPYWLLLALCDEVVFAALTAKMNCIYRYVLYDTRPPQAAWSVLPHHSTPQRGLHLSTCEPKTIAYTFVYMFALRVQYCVVFLYEPKATSNPTSNPRILNHVATRVPSAGWLVWGNEQGSQYILLW